MPIKGLSEQRRMPRLGKIHLGIKKKSERSGKEYPSATDYFVCPDEVQSLYGKKPKELPILIPVEDEEYWASQYYRAYSMTRGLVCRGDGERCNRQVDTATGEFANRDTKEVVWKQDLPCEGQDCPYYKAKKCSEMMCLQFLLPDVPGLGVWQIDTGSINSIRNINSAAHLIRGVCGRVRMIPLLLTLEKQEVINPDDGKKKTVYCMNLRHKETAGKLLADLQRPIHELLVQAPVDDQPAEDTLHEIEPDMTDEEAEKAKDELWGDLESESSPTIDDKPSKKQKPKDSTREAMTDLTLKDLLEWVASHGKQYNGSWIQENCSCTMDQIKADPNRYYEEILKISGWDPSQHGQSASITDSTDIDYPRYPVILAHNNVLPGSVPHRLNGEI